MADPRNVVRRFVDEALGAGDPAAIDELIASAPVRQRVLAFREAFPDLTIRIEQLVGEGDLVAVRATGRGTHAGTFQGVPPTGRTWTAPCTAIYRVMSGVITDGWVQWDLLAILEQIGGVRRLDGASA